MSLERLGDRGRPVLHHISSPRVGSGPAMVPCARPGCGHAAFWHVWDRENGCMWIPEPDKRAGFNGCPCAEFIKPEPKEKRKK